LRNNQRYNVSAGSKNAVMHHLKYYAYCFCTVSLRPLPRGESGLTSSPASNFGWITGYPSVIRLGKVRPCRSDATPRGSIATSFIIVDMDNRLPLSALLSHVLVAFTIEFDNESEHQMPHRTTNHGSTAGSLDVPWLVSLAMWDNCMRFVGENGVTVHVLEKLAHATTNLNGMERWGYIVIKPDPADTRLKPPRRDWMIRATPAGRKAQEVWRPLFGTIERRWQTRFGKREINQLRESLLAVISQIKVELPDSLPILGYGLFSKGLYREQGAAAGRKDDAGSRLPLSALLSRVLLAFAIEFERESDLSLAMCANVVRVLDEKGVRIRDLSRLSGVSKELIKVSLAFLGKHGYLVLAPDGTTKGTSMVLLTPKGREAQNAYHKGLSIIEKRWQARFGKDAVRKLRGSLECLVGEPPARKSPLFRGLNPYPEGWRASVDQPDTLPHYPLVTHRGGFPDGS
jgi:DNA-binding MarR family transcriptional regulator